jgi:hypothetical protein
MTVSCTCVASRKELDEFLVSLGWPAYVAGIRLWSQAGLDSLRGRRESVCSSSRGHTLRRALLPRTGPREEY